MFTIQELSLVILGSYYKNTRNEEAAPLYGLRLNTVPSKYRMFHDVLLAKIQDRVLEVIWNKKKSNKLQVDSTPFSSYALVKRAVL
jgi:hypothetical protein